MPSLNHCYIFCDLKTSERKRTLRPTKKENLTWATQTEWQFFSCCFVGLLRTVECKYAQGSIYINALTCRVSWETDDERWRGDRQEVSKSSQVPAFGWTLSHYERFPKSQRRKIARAFDTEKFTLEVETWKSLSAFHLRLHKSEFEKINNVWI